jgi:hypothetical protein
MRRASASAAELRGFRLAAVFESWHLLTEVPRRNPQAYGELP